MKVLGIDYGAKRIGIAVSDANGSFAFPKMTIPNDPSTLDRIHSIVKSEGIEAIVIGDSRAATGGDNPITHEANDFSEALSKITAKPIERIWEAWSSVEARRFAPKGKEHDDAAAAAIILQRYLDVRPQKRA